MTENLDEEALRYHRLPKPGKLEIVATKPLATQHDLSLAYSPGVAAACREIVDDPANVSKYTLRGNLVGVVTNGTAVLGLGSIGPLASKPVMEGKAVLFKKFAGIDVFDIEINETDPQKMIDIIAFDEGRFVSDGLLLLVNGTDVVSHAFGADLHISDLVITERFRVAVPDIDGMGHQFAHRRLKVIVSDNAAGYAAGAGRDSRLIQDHDVLATSFTGSLQALGQTPGRAQTMNSRSDNDVLAMGRYCHLTHSLRFTSYIYGLCSKYGLFFDFSPVFFNKLY